MSLNLTPLKKSINSLEELLIQVNDEESMCSFNDVVRNGLKAGLIQNFEFTYELCWKFMKRWLEVNIGHDEVDGIIRKELFRISAENRLIEDPLKWFTYLKARNLTSHTYNEEKAKEVLSVLSDFLKEAKSLLKALEAKND